MTYMSDFLMSVEPIMPPYVITTYEWKSALRRAERLSPTRDSVCQGFVEDWFYENLLAKLAGRAEKRRLTDEWKLLRRGRKGAKVLINKKTHLQWCAKALLAGDLPTALQQGCMELAHNYGGRYQTAFREVEFLKDMRTIMRRAAYAHVQMEMFTTQAPTPPDA